MKARDIIPGWPKGKSTESRARDWEYREFWIWPWQMWTEETREYLRDNREYHELQQRLEDFRYRVQFKKVA